MLTSPGRCRPPSVIPAKAGIQRCCPPAMFSVPDAYWIPAFAGMTGNVNTTWWANTFVLMGGQGNHKGCPCQAGAVP